jgi:hypothetical protein
MARAGFYAVHNSQIRFGRDGRWYADGEPIVNPRIADLFSRHVERRVDGGYRLRIGDEQAPIVVDDTPYVVIAAEVTADRGVAIELNDRSRERLDPATLEIGPDEVLYCRVKGGGERARFLRAAYYQLAEHIDAERPGRFVLHLAGGDYPIGRR